MSYIKSVIWNLTNYFKLVKEFPDLIKFDHNEGIIINNEQYKLCDENPKLKDLLMHINSSTELQRQGHIQDLFLSQQLLKNGIRAMRPTTPQFNTAVSTHLNVSFEDYHQPYPLFFIELPKEYRTGTILTGLGDIGNRIGKLDFSPGCVALYCDKTVDIIFILVFAITGRKRIHVYAFPDKGRNTIEQFLDDLWEAWQNHRKVIEVIRGALNCCLLLDSYGTVTKPKIESIAMPEDLREARQPSIVYNFKSEIKLTPKLITAPTTTTESTSTGRTMPYHIVRGHWRKVRCGPGRKLWRMVRIAPYEVNPHLYKGEAIDTDVSYKLNDDQL